MAGWSALELYAADGGTVTATIENVGTGLQCLFMGALVPLIVSTPVPSCSCFPRTLIPAGKAIYPTLIIVLVSLEQSPFESGMKAAPRPFTPGHPSTLPRYSDGVVATTEIGTSSMKSVQ